MKRMLLLLVVFLFAFQSYAAFNIIAPTLTEPSVNAAQIFVSVGNTGKKISLLQLSKINVVEFEILSGHSLKGLDKASFKIAQRKLQKSILADGSIKKRRLQFFAAKMADREKGFHMGGFALGFFAGWVGVLLAYLAFKDVYKQNRIKWAWIGFGIGAVLSLMLIIAIIISFTQVGFR